MSWSKQQFVHWLSLSTIAFLLSVNTTLSADALHEQEASETFLRIASSAYGSGFRQSASTLAGLFNWRFLVDQEYPGESHPLAVPMSSPGSLTNMGDLLSGRAEIALVRADLADSAYRNPDKLGFEDQVKQLRIVATHKPALLHVLVRADFKGDSLADLARETVSVGTGNATLYGLRQLLQIHAAPVSELNVVHVPIGESLKRLEQGKLSAVIFIDQAPSNLVADALANSRLKLLSLDPDKIEQTIRLKQDQPIQAVEASSVYSNVDGIHTVQIPVVLLTHRHVSSSTVEAVLNVLNARGASLRAAPDARTAFTPSLIDPRQSAIPLHPASKLLLELYTGPLSQTQSERSEPLQQSSKDDL